MGVSLSTEISDFSPVEASPETSLSCCFGENVLQEIRKPPYFCSVRAHWGSQPQGCCLGAEEGFVPDTAEQK